MSQGELVNKCRVQVDGWVGKGIVDCSPSATQVLRSRLIKEMSEGELVSGCRDQVDGWVRTEIVGLLTKCYTGIEVLMK